MTICVICSSIEVKQVFLVYFTAPCRVNKTKNLISRKVYRSGTKAADLKCKEGFQLFGTINGARPICFNGTWMFDGKKFPYCDTEVKANRVVDSFWHKLFLSGG